MDTSEPHAPAVACAKGGWKLNVSKGNGETLCVCSPARFRPYWQLVDVMVKSRVNVTAKVESLFDADRRLALARNLNPHLFFCRYRQSFLLLLMVYGVELSLSSAAGVTAVTLIGTILLLFPIMGVPFFSPRWTCKGKVRML